MPEFKPVARKNDIVVQEFGNEILVYDLKINKAFSLNETSAKIWQLCDGNRTISEIARHLTGKFDAPISADFVLLAIDQLNRDNLLTGISQQPIFGDLSRREVIRKIGFASLVALPIVSSLIAPKAIEAASCASADGGLQCRCPCATPNGSSCGNGLAVDNCSPGQTCTRNAVSCYGGANPCLASTSQGSCA